MQTTWQNFLPPGQSPSPQQYKSQGGYKKQMYPGGISILTKAKSPDQEYQESLNRQLEQAALGQQTKAAEKQLREQQEITSGRFMLGGQAVTSDQMREYQKRIKESLQADPMYLGYKQGLENPTEQVFDEQDYVDYQNRMSDPKYRDYQQRALKYSLQQFQKDPVSYLIGGGQSGSTYSPSDLLEYLGLGQQLFRATGQEGNFMDFLLGGMQPSVTNPPNPSPVALNPNRDEFGQYKSPMSMSSGYGKPFPNIF